MPEPTKPNTRTTPSAQGFQPLSEWKIPTGWTDATAAFPDTGAFATVLDGDDIKTDDTTGYVYLNKLEPTYSITVKFAVSHETLADTVIGEAMVFGILGTSGSGATEVQGDYLGKVTFESGATELTPGSKMLGSQPGQCYWCSFVEVDETMLDTSEFRAFEDAAGITPGWLRITKYYPALLFILKGGSGVGCRLEYREMNSLV